MTGYFLPQWVIGVINNCYKDKLAKLDKFVEKHSDLVIRKDGITNGYVNYIMVWDGSKEGWDTSKKADDIREKFIDLLKECEADWYKISDGEDFEVPIMSSYRDAIREESTF